MTSQIIHMIAGIALFIPMAIILVLAILGLSLVEDCMINDNCEIKSTEAKFTELQFSLLWTLMTLAPFVMLFGLVYFAFFTKFSFNFFKRQDVKKP